MSSGELQKKNANSQYVVRSTVYQLQKNTDLTIYQIDDWFTSDFKQVSQTKLIRYIGDFYAENVRS